MFHVTSSVRVCFVIAPNRLVFEPSRIRWPVEVFDVQTEFERKKTTKQGEDDMATKQEMAELDRLETGSPSLGDFVVCLFS